MLRVVQLISWFLINVRPANKLFLIALHVPVVLLALLATLQQSGIQTGDATLAQFQTVYHVQLITRVFRVPAGTN